MATSVTMQVDDKVMRGFLEVFEVIRAGRILNGFGTRKKAQESIPVGPQVDGHGTEKK